MAEIVPFRAVTYDCTAAGALESNIAPPYDVLSADEQGSLYAASPHNCVRIILNRAEPGDGLDDSYARAADYLSRWLQSGILREDPEPALWLYRQEFTSPVDGTRLQRYGVFCALKLEPYSSGVVLPHETTRSGAKEDRLRLMRVLRANPEPIYGLYEDRGEHTLAGMMRRIAAEPDLSAVIDGDRHDVWRIADPDVVVGFQSALRDRRIWIADGHHRYETAIAYRDERRASCDDPDAAEHILIALTPFEDPGLLVLPTHRLVRGLSADLVRNLPQSLDREFVVEKTTPERLADAMSPSSSADCHRFGMLLADGAWTLTLRTEAAMDGIASGASEAWRLLDVSILQALVLDRALGIPMDSLATTANVGYTRDRAEAERLVRSGDYQAAFILNVTSADDVRMVAAAGDRMPPKSTFFYPKLWSGLVLRRLDDRRLP